MKLIWHVAAYEYTRNVWKRSFIFIMLSVPLLISFSVGLGLFMESQQASPRSIGIVDQAQYLIAPADQAAIQAHLNANDEQGLEFILYKDQATARSALENKTIQAYFLLPVDYSTTRQVELLFSIEPGRDAWNQFFDILQFKLLSKQSPEVAERLTRGAEFIVRSVDGRRVVPPASGPTFGLMMPLFIAMAFLFLLLMSSGYMMTAIADEKENRTMEVVLTSITPLQFIGGKILGVVGISLTLLLSWALVAATGILIGRQAGVAWLSNLRMDWVSVLGTVLVAIPSYILAAALMVAIGALVNTVQEGQSISSLFAVLHIAPLYVGWSFLNNPQSTLAGWLSMLPFTSLMTISLRNLSTIVPTWQIVVSMLVQSLCALGAIWLASRAFRLGALRYGQGLKISRLFKLGRAR